MIPLICYVFLTAHLPAQEPHMADGNTQLLYHLNEATGTAAADASGNQRNGVFGTGISINSASMPFFQKSVQPGMGLTGRVQWTHTGAGANSFLYPIAGADFTIEGWFKLGTTSFSNSRTLFAVQPTGVATFDYQLIVVASTDATRPLGLVFRDGPAYRCFTNSLTWDTSLWYHIAVVVKHDGAAVTYSIYRTPQGSLSPVLVATRVSTALTPAPGNADRVFSIGNFYGNWGADFFPGLIDEVRYSDVARSSDDLRVTVHPNVYDRIRREAFAPNSQTDNPLPLFSGWNTGIYSYLYGKPDDFGYSPAWQVTQIAAGRHLLPWFATPNPDINSSSASWNNYLRYYENPLKEVAQHGLPISFVGTQWEQYLSGAPYKDYALMQNPNVSFVNEEGTALTALSPFGPINLWTEIGQKWANCSLMQTVQNWYPNPPFVIFVSNNEAAKMKYQYITQDQHYLAKYGTATRTDDFKREVIGNGWIERYRALQSGWREDLSASWKDNSIFVGYGAIGPSLLGRVSHWQTATLTIPNRLSPWPLAWDGCMADNYLTSKYTYNNDHQVYSPQIESMNLELMRREAIAQNPSFWFELGTWNGGDYSAPWTGNEDIIAKEKLCRFNPKAVPLPAEGQPDTLVQPVANPYIPVRYGGMVQFTMWILRPRVVRDYRLWSSARADYDGVLPYFGSSQPYVDSLMNAVDKIYSNEVLQLFWRNSELVVNPSRVHPYQQAIPPEFNEVTHPVSAARMYLLKTNLDPSGTWGLTTQLSVFAMARVRGTSPNREWLLYAFAPAELPLGSAKSAQVTIPGYGDVPIDATLDGQFYLVKESTNQAYPID